MVNAVQRVVLVRHGQTEWAASGRHTGRTDVALDATGCKQAAALAWLAKEPFALVLSSPLARATDTAALAGFPHAIVDPDLEEWDYGSYEGLTTEEIRTRVPDWTIWTGNPPGGESIDDVAVRTRRVLERVTAVAGDVLLFGHAHALRVLAACWLELPADGGRYLALDPASVSSLGYERETRVIWRWNTTATLLP